MNTYDNPFYEDNVYGHAVGLLTKNAPATASAQPAIHLDIGCSVGRMAEPITERLGSRYIGFDIDAEAMSALQERGFDVHRIDLNDLAAAETIIRDAIGSNRVGSMSIIDVLEHVADPLAVVGMLRRVATTHCCPLVVSVPNVAHRDVGFKLAFGRWDYTDTGLLDRTHLRGFTQYGLKATMRAAGWHLVESNDVQVVNSDQHFPKLHPALASSTLLHEFLAQLRDGVDATARTNQFVGVYLPGPSAQTGFDDANTDSETPFLSVITRTQGRRIDTLRDVLLCLSAQTCQNFEVCVIGHKLSSQAQLDVERIIEDTHEELRARVRLIRVEDGNRTKPLNVGFESARGHYVAILDDDDIVLGHWVESFRAMAAQNPGRVLRAANMAQTWEPVTTTFGKQSVRAVSGMDACYPDTFDFFQHLIENETPPVSLAFPRAAFEGLGIRFDESLTTTEDWDFFMRTAAICGVASLTEITSIYRKWLGAESSFSIHSKDEWRANHLHIWRKLDNLPILLESGAATRLRYLVEDRNRHNGRGAGPLPDPESDQGRYENALREQIHLLRHSVTWNIGSPVRLVARLLGRRYPYPMLWAMTGRQLQQHIEAIKASLPWKFAERIKSLVGRR
ncbi:methyltransferase domain-containing protein [Rhodanobacter sp. Col0626]|uniref:methyltransferase domain-containing protein n=1 Tax=Rhodanobacter sp. Col0626 TaxID=3415679 RepID=UPI003CF57CF0